MYNKVSNRQIVFILFIVLTSVAMISLPKIMAATAGQGTWFTIILTSLIFAVMAAIIIKLSKMHEGKVLFDYSRDIAERFVPYLLAAFYVLYFLIVDAYLCSGCSRWNEIHHVGIYVGDGKIMEASSSKT